MGPLNSKSCFGIYNLIPKPPSPKKISSLELTKIYLERIKLFDNKLNAFITITDKLALKQAEKADEEIKKGMYRG